MATNSKQLSEKTVCTNPNSGNTILIDTDTYILFKKAICHTLKTNPGITYSEIVMGIKKYFKEKAVKFSRSVEWYGVVVKQDMEVKKIIETYTGKRKKLHRLAN